MQQSASVQNAAAHAVQGSASVPQQEKPQRGRTAPAAPPSASPVSAGAAGSRHLRGLSVETTGSSDADADMRPALYPESHKPKPSVDALEAHQWAETQVLDALRQDSFEGFYNVAMLAMVFAFAYIIVRNIREKGLLLDLEDFTCAPVHRDWLWAGLCVCAAYLWSLTLLGLMHLWVRGRVSWLPFVCSYATIQCTMLAAPIAFLYMSPVGPLSSAGVLMVVIVLMLKMHSYAATNFAMASEHRERFAGASAAEASAQGMVAPLASGPFDRLPPRKKRGAKHHPLQRSASARGGGSGKGRGGSAAGEDDEEIVATEVVAAATSSAVATSGGSGSSANGLRRRHPSASPVRTPTATEVTGFAPLATDAATGFPASAPSAAAAAAGVPAAPPQEGQVSASLTVAERSRLIRAWPDNVSMRDYLYFLAVPTLVYEPKYPRTTRRRWGYIAKKAAEMLGCCAVMYFVFRQFIIPVLAQASQPRNSGALASVGALVFDLMKLALPSLAIWLTGFYMLFHCFLNILAELCRYADRSFFLPWWNATRIDEFWREWNIAVHEWCLRHIYLDLQYYTGMDKKVASFATFFFSAVFHEIIFSVSLKTFRPWFFLGMLLQIPLMAVGRNLSSRKGNYLVWWSLFSGQPLLELLYFREYFSTHTSLFCNEGATA
jgi:hypothetical protein